MTCFVCYPPLFRESPQNVGSGSASLGWPPRLRAAQRLGQGHPMEGEAWMGQRDPQRSESGERQERPQSPLGAETFPSPLQSGPLRSGTSSYPPHWHLSWPLYGLCTLTCIRVGGDVPSFRQYLLTVREGPLFINLLSSKHHDAVVGQARPWVWGTGAMPPCDGSRGGLGCDGRDPSRLWEAEPDRGWVAALRF